MQSPQPPSAPSAAAPVPPSAAAGRARSCLEAGKTKLLERHRAGAGGQEIVRAFSDLTDQVLQLVRRMKCGIETARGAGIACGRIIAVRKSGSRGSDLVR